MTSDSSMLYWRYILQLKLESKPMNFGEGSEYMEYNLDGMSCNHCVKTVEKYFQEKGIPSKVSLKDKKLTLERELSPDEFTSVKVDLSEEGYQLTQVNRL